MSWGYKPYSNDDDDTLETYSFKGFDDKDFPENFQVIARHWPYIKFKHKVTKEIKWVSLFAIKDDGIANAFYDAKFKFNPEDDNGRKK